MLFILVAHILVRGSFMASLLALYSRHIYCYRSGTRIGD
jgi:hypothetical protein